MKNIAVFLLCLSMLSASAVVASAEEEPNTAPGEATIGTEVPDSHEIIITVKGNVDFTLNGKTGTEFEVERLSEPTLEIKAKDGEKITKVTINGVDVTDQLVDGKYKLPPVYENETLNVNVETEALPDDSSKPDSSTPDTSTPDTPVSDSSTPDNSTPSSSSAADSSKSDSSSSASSSPSSSSNSVPTNSGSPVANTGGDNANPATGVVSGVSLGSGLLVAALLITKRKSRDKEE